MPRQSPNLVHLGRRVADRREHLGLSRADLAARSGMDPGYVAYLEETTTAVVGHTTMIRLAVALETTLAALLDDAVDRPAGQGSTASLGEMDEDECWQLLSRGGVGRFVFLAPRGPVAVPVNYQIVEGTMVFRTAEGSSLARVRDGEAVSLEVDHIDEPNRLGWSVLASGIVEHAPGPADVDPWAGGTRETYLRFVPIEVTGRRLSAPGRGPGAG